MTNQKWVTAWVNDNYITCSVGASVVKHLNMCHAVEHSSSSCICNGKAVAIKPTIMTCETLHYGHPVYYTANSCFYCSGAIKIISACWSESETIMLTASTIVFTLFENIIFTEHHLRVYLFQRIYTDMTCWTSNHKWCICNLPLHLHLCYD